VNKNIGEQAAFAIAASRESVRDINRMSRLTKVRSWVRYFFSFESFFVRFSTLFLNSTFDFKFRALTTPHSRVKFRQEFTTAGSQPFNTVVGKIQIGMKSTSPAVEEVP